MAAALPELQGVDVPSLHHPLCPMGSQVTPVNYGLAATALGAEIRKSSRHRVREPDAAVLLCYWPVL